MFIFSIVKDGKEVFRKWDGMKFYFFETFFPCEIVVKPRIKIICYSRKHFIIFMV